jgi:hypothetical protein
MPRRFAVAAALVAAFSASGCVRLLSAPSEAPAYYTQVTDKGWLYAHNWAGAPCFTIELLGETWRLAKSDPEKITWVRGEEVLSIMLEDNRKLGFAVAKMLPEDALRAYLGYQAEIIRPLFEFQIIHPPKFTTEYDGTWMGWGWEGKGGKRRGVRAGIPADQKHVVMSLWQDPYVMSFDWGGKGTTGATEPTLEMVMMLETLEFHPECFGGRPPSRKPAATGGRPYRGSDFSDELEKGEGGDGFSPSTPTRPRR